MELDAIIYAVGSVTSEWLEEEQGDEIIDIIRSRGFDILPASMVRELVLYQMAMSKEDRDARLKEMEKASV